MNGSKKRTKEQNNERLFIKWTVATAVGFTLGGVLVPLLSSVLFGGFLTMESAPTLALLGIGGRALAGLVYGLVVSGCQWFILRKLRETAVRWLLVSGVGTMLAFTITPLFCHLIRWTNRAFSLGCGGSIWSGPFAENAILTGLIIGTAQWLYLRKWLPYAWSWIIATIVSAVLLSMMYTMSFGAVFSQLFWIIPIFLAIPAAVTGTALQLLWARRDRGFPHAATT